MDSQKSMLHFFLFLLAIRLAYSSHISNEVLEPHGSVGRTLLQQKAKCQVNFENMNYTVMTSQCKGPNYTPERCCSPLKELVCPVSEQFNDLNTDCADTFFSYVNLYGRYPPGLFANLCKEDQDGLNCPALSPSSNGADSKNSHSSMMMLVSGLMGLAMFYI